MSISVLSAALVLALASAASAQNVNRLTTKSYQPIGKQKLQVDLTQVDAGELYRELRDHLKTVLERQGNPVGSSTGSAMFDGRPALADRHSRRTDPPTRSPQRRRRSRASTVI
jgi:hypothetical protein